MLGRTGAIVIAVAIVVWIRHHEAASARTGVVSDVVAVTGEQPGDVRGEHVDDPAAAPALHERAPETIVISGTVIDQADGSPVGGVEVVLRGVGGESTTTSEPSGEYAIALAPGIYRAFVRDDAVMSVGRPDRDAHAEIPNLPDESLMASIVAMTDTHGIELGVVRGGAITGRIVDDNGDPIEGAIVEARSRRMRPTLGTDVTESDADGSFELRVPMGGYSVEVSHPRFAATASYVEVLAHEVASFTMSKGCTISGRVVGARGAPAGDGEIERLIGFEDFTEHTTIEHDGTFRVTTTSEGSITLRAAAARSTVSLPRTFECHEGLRFSNVVFAVTAKTPDLEGSVVDVNGAPVPLAVVELEAIDQYLANQHVRTDSEGRWQIYEAPPGRYEIRAAAQGRGVVAMELAAPKREVVLRLGGTGRIAGTTTTLVNGSFELSLGSCADPIYAELRDIALARDVRIVAVTAGHFAISDLPACQLTFTARWRDKLIQSTVDVAGSDAADVELEIGPPRAKTVHGVVLDADEHPVPNVPVTATLDGVQSDAVTTDGSGHYFVHAFAGSTISAGGSSRRVSTENVDDEELDLGAYAVLFENQ